MTTVACHANEQVFGKGRGIKAEDCYTVWGCAPCHRELDQGMQPKGIKAKAWRDAFARQLIEWQKIADNPTTRPWKQEAASKALEYLKDKDGH